MGGRPGTAITFVARADVILFRERDKLTYQTRTFTLCWTQPTAYTGVNTTFHADDDDIHRVHHRKLAIEFRNL